MSEGGREEREKGGRDGLRKWGPGEEGGLMEIERR